MNITFMKQYGSGSIQLAGFGPHIKVKRRIRIKVKGWIRIRIKVKGCIRIRIKMVWICKTR